MCDGMLRWPKFVGNTIFCYSASILRGICLSIYLLELWILKAVFLF